MIADDAELHVSQGDHLETAVVLFVDVFTLDLIIFPQTRGIDLRDAGVLGLGAERRRHER